MTFLFPRQETTYLKYHGSVAKGKSDIRLTSFYWKYSYFTTVHPLTIFLKIYLCEHHKNLLGELHKFLSCKYLIAI